MAVSLVLTLSTQNKTSWMNKREVEVKNLKIIIKKKVFGYVVYVVEWEEWVKRRQYGTLMLQQFVAFLGLNLSQGLE
jgi:hypothetical protein